MLVGSEQDRLLCEVAECVKGFNDIPARLVDLTRRVLKRSCCSPNALVNSLSGDDKTLAMPELRPLLLRRLQRIHVDEVPQAPGRLYFVGIPIFGIPPPRRIPSRTSKSSRQRSDVAVQSP